MLGGCLRRMGEESKAYMYKILKRVGDTGAKHLLPLFPSNGCLFSACENKSRFNIRPGYTGAGLGLPVGSHTKLSSHTNSKGDCHSHLCRTPDHTRLSSCDVWILPCLLSLSFLPPFLLLLPRHSLASFLYKA